VRNNSSLVIFPLSREEMTRSINFELKIDLKFPGRVFSELFSDVSSV
jgi:hypothetical protein